MTYDLNYEGFEDYLLERTVDIGDDVRGDYVHYIFRFDNHYGASIVKGYGTIGYSMDLWELAVVWFLPWSNSDKYDLIYSTPITDDVIGCLDDERVRELLKQIKDLKGR